MRREITNCQRPSAGTNRPLAHMQRQASACAANRRVCCLVLHTCNHPGNHAGKMRPEPRRQRQNTATFGNRQLATPDSDRSIRNRRQNYASGSKAATAESLHLKKTDCRKTACCPIFSKPRWSQLGNVANLTLASSTRVCSWKVLSCGTNSASTIHC